MHDFISPLPHFVLMLDDNDLCAADVYMYAQEQQPVGQLVRDTAGVMQVRERRKDEVLNGQRTD